MCSWPRPGITEWQVLAHIASNSALLLLRQTIQTVSWIYMSLKLAPLTSSSSSHSSVILNPSSAAQSSHSTPDFTAASSPRPQWATVTPKLGTEMLVRTGSNPTNPSFPLRIATYRHTYHPQPIGWNTIRLAAC